MKLACSLQHRGKYTFEYGHDVTFACHQLSGTVPSCRDLLKMIVRIGACSEAQSFMIEPEYSMVWLLFGGKLCVKTSLHPFLQQVEI